MNWRRCISTIGYGLLALGAARVSSAEPQQVVILQGSATLEHSVLACKNNEQGNAPDRRVTTACRDYDPQEQAKDYERAILTEAASTLPCKGVTWARGYLPDSSAAVSALINRSHWILSINFVPGLKRQKWKLKPQSLPGSASAEGEATAVETVARVCAIVGGRGATIVR
jgi:hypothetical protein